MTAFIGHRLCLTGFRLFQQLFRVALISFITSAIMERSKVSFISVILAPPIRITRVNRFRNVLTFPILRRPVKRRTKNEPRLAVA